MNSIATIVDTQVDELMMLPGLAEETFKDNEKSSIEIESEPASIRDADGTKKDKSLLSHTFVVKLMELKENREFAFEDIVKRHGTRQENGCVTATNSYKSVSIMGTTIALHKLIFLLFNEQIPIQTIQEEKMVVRHQCGNNKCFEHSHLEIGTFSQNNFDDRIRDETMLNGEKHHAASITEDRARKIMDSKVPRADSAYLTQRERAENFGVSLKLVKNIDIGHSWGHLRDGGNDRMRKKRTEDAIRARNKTWDDQHFGDAESRIRDRIRFEVCPVKGLEGDCHIWTGTTNRDGYGYLTIHSKPMRAHVLALECYLKRHRQASEVTRHLCGVKKCCNPLHLQFGTQSENSIDAVRHGHAKTNLDIDKVRRIKEALLEGTSRSFLASEYGCQEDTIRQIDTGASWKHVLVDGWVSSQIRNKNRIGVKDAKQIKNDLRTGLNRKEIAEKFACSVDVIRCIDKGKTWKTV